MMRAEKGSQCVLLGSEVHTYNAKFRFMSRGVYDCPFRRGTSLVIERYVRAQRDHALDLLTLNIARLVIPYAWFLLDQLHRTANRLRRLSWPVSGSSQVGLSHPLGRSSDASLSINLAAASMASITGA